MSRSLIIAEAGVNHNGDMGIARQLIEVAADAGADYVKFQSFKAELGLVSNAPKAAYQINETGEEQSQLEMIKNLELSESQHEEIMEHCRKVGIQFLSTAFDFWSIGFLRSHGLRLWKIPSGEITNFPYLRKIGSFDEEMIVSTGMCTLDEVAAALAVFEDAGASRQKITLLHRNTEYPTPISDVNLNAMKTLYDSFPGLKGVGYSDHTLGIEVPIAAVAMGATVIEKHFTVDRTLPGPDHQASLNPDELVAMVRAIRNIEEALGDGVKRPSPSELKNRPIARKSIVAAKSIAEGERFSEKNLTVKRPGTGLSPMQWDDVVGRTALRDYEEDDLIDA